MKRRTVRETHVRWLRGTVPLGPSSSSLLLQSRELRSGEELFRSILLSAIFSAVKAVVVNLAFLAGGFGGTNGLCTEIGEQKLQDELRRKTGGKIDTDGN